ncbi:MAG: tetratricopeptide repeat protein [Bacteroidetes bacterium]|nr:tetratricopeptide repeat protein [Bacteroidota bacterium]
MSFQSRIDSIQTLINNSTLDTAKITYLIAIARGYEIKDRLKAFDYANVAYALAQKTGDKNKIGECLNYLGDLNLFTGDYASSSDYYFKALHIYEGLNDKAGMAECYRNIGWIYQGQGLYKKTIEYYNKSLEINTQLGLKRKMVANYDDIGITKKILGDYPEAIRYCKLTIKLSQEIKSTKGLAIGYGNLANVYVSMKQYDLAIENFMLGIKFHELIEDKFNFAEGNYGLADCYFKIGNYFKTIEYAEKSAAIAEKFDYKTIASSDYKLLAEAYSRRADFANAFKYLNLYTDLKDSTYNEKNSRQINEMSAKYESEKKELMINSLEKDKTLSEEKSAQDKKFKLYMMIFCMMIIVFAISLFRSNMQKKKTNSSLSLAYKEIEVKNKDITDSINYAKQIQRARLPNPSIILKHLPEAFGLYKPKDVVSGDFYWFAEHENGKLLLAAADCTGHGIPGAFMSLIGIDELNHATLEKRLSHTSTILSSVNKGVKKALRQNEQNSMSRDGMDIALCIFDLKNNTLEYSGANRPLYYIRDNKLHEITPTKAAIGGTTENDQEFKSHTIELKKHDMIYVFTDGFADQFGGESGKKFMTKRFKDLLLSIHNKPIPEQEALLEKSLNDWKKDISQVDDILVLGIRI